MHLIRATCQNKITRAFHPFKFGKKRKRKRGCLFHIFFWIMYWQYVNVYNHVIKYYYFDCRITFADKMPQEKCGWLLYYQIKAECRLQAWGNKNKIRLKPTIVLQRFIMWCRKRRMFFQKRIVNSVGTIVGGGKSRLCIMNGVFQSIPNAIPTFLCTKCRRQMTFFLTADYRPDFLFMKTDILHIQGTVW